MCILIYIVNVYSAGNETHAQVYHRDLDLRCGVTSVWGNPLLPEPAAEHIVGINSMK